MKLKLLTSKNKLFLGFLIIVVICLIVIFINQSLKEKQLQMKNDLLAQKNILIQIQKINRIGLISENEGAYYFLSFTEEDKNRHLESYKKSVEELNIELENFRNILNGTENISSLNNFEKSWYINLQDNELAFQLEREGNKDKALAVFTKLAFKDIKKHLFSLRDKQREVVDEKQRNIDRNDLIVQYANTGITIAFILITIILGWILSRKIQLEHHLETQKQFYQNTSHELKTPLMSIQGYAQAIMDGTIQDEKVDHSLKIIISESDRLKRLVTEMILLSKLENENNFEWHSVPVEYLIDESIFRIKPLLKEKGVTIELHSSSLNNAVSPLVKVDSEKCLQALLNILSNSIRYAKHVIEISVSEERHQVSIDIKDDGLGIPEETLSHLFERFFKGKDGENGLGLTISRAIIEHFGGSIKAWNHKDGGAVFRIILPTAVL